MQLSKDREGTLLDDHCMNKFCNTLPSDVRILVSCKGPIMAEQGVVIFTTQYVTIATV